jgi:hypothetical protein
MRPNSDVDDAFMTPELTCCQAVVGDEGFEPPTPSV